MRFLPLLAAIACTPAVAQEVSFDCDALYAELIADKPINLDSCTVEVADYTLDQCTPPSSFNSTRPTSHLILAIDASGSMAGRVGGETKMEIAKREALSFLNDIPEEVDVGLVVYGHKGTNQEDGRAESCAASELVHDFDANRRALQDSIRDLSPTGWTPLGGVLDYSQTVIADLDPPREGDLAPVVYLISDGEETCDGDPVAAAGALFDAGVQTTVNTIGFDVDPETAAQLEAIAEAAGGIYYPAEDARALRAQLNAIKEAEAELTRYQNCVFANSGRIAMVYHNARIELAGCYARNNPAHRVSAVLNATNKAEREGRPEAQCKRLLQDRVLEETSQYRYWLSERNDALTYPPLELIEEYRAGAALDVLKAAE